MNCNRGKRFFRLTFALLLLLGLLQGCFPFIGKFYYISLENVPGIQVTSTGKFDFVKVYFHEEMPLSYKLIRTTYTLYFALDPHSFGADLFVRAADSSGTLNIVEDYIDGSICGGLVPLNTLNYTPLWNGLRAMEYNIRWKNIAPCNFDDPMKISSEYKIISFKIIDAEGSLLGEEKIPFNTIRNGFYIGYDSL